MLAMEKNRQQILEELIHRELSKLHERQAPDTLARRVLGQIESRERRQWWQRPWTQWPGALQAGFVLLLLSGGVGAVFTASAVQTLFDASVISSALSEAVGFASTAWELCTVLGNALLMLCRAIGQEWLLLGILVWLSMYLACVGLGTLCYRTVWARR